MPNISPDIYDLHNFVNDIKRNFIDESDETLSMSTLGYMGETFANMMQNNIIIGSELVNEMFPTRVKYEKYILEHAMTYNITDINAIPSKMDVIIALAEPEVIELIRKSNEMQVAAGKNPNNSFYLDKESKIYIGNYEFHLDYDIIITKSVLNNSDVVYSARYNINRHNEISNIRNPYLAPPTKSKVNNDTFLFIKCTIRQIERVDIYKKIISNNAIDNKTLDFEFENQLACFEIYDAQKDIYITPIFEGSIPNIGIEYYCYYSYSGANTIRVTFNRDSYEPSLNNDIVIRVSTTQGLKGVFKYSEDIITSLSSSKYAYENLSTLIIPVTDSLYGENRKSINELKKIIPKESLSRGNLTSETDLDNYFNSIDTDDNKLTFKPKIDNQKERLFYSYLLLKDEYGNIIPTNTIDLKIIPSNISNEYENRLVVQPHAVIGYNSISSYAVIIPQNKGKQKTNSSGAALFIDNKSGLETTNATTDGKSNKIAPAKDSNGNTIYIDRISSKDTLDMYTTSDYKFVYSIPFLMIINKTPLYTSYYLNIVNRNYQLNFDYINSNSELQFVSTKINWKRDYNEDSDKYKLNIQAAQNINDDKGLVVLDDKGNITQKNIRFIAVLYENGAPYRWAEANLKSYNKDSFTYSFEFEFQTNDIIDNRNYIRINDLYEIGTTTKNYGYINDNPNIDIYMLAKLSNEYGRSNIDSIVPGLDGWTVCNKYSSDGGINFFYNYSSIISSKISVDKNDSDLFYIVKGIPAVKKNYIEDKKYTEYLMNHIDSKRNYINNALDVLENSFGIDFKFYNTYGPSRTFMVDGEKYLDRVNLTLNFEIGLLAAADKYTIDNVIQDIKSYMENLNNSNTNIHISNLITFITNKYSSTIAFIEFLGANNYPVGIQYFSKITTNDITIVPEFLNINAKDDFTPDINITIV